MSDTHNTPTPETEALRNARDRLKYISMYARLGSAAFAIAILGQYIKDWTDAEGALIAPRFLRHHLSNLADVTALAPGFNALAIGVKALGQKSRPLLTGAAAFGVGVAWEGIEAYWRKGGYDFGDVACYAASSALYLVIAREIDKRNFVPVAGAPRP